MSIEVKLFKVPILLENANLHDRQRLETLSGSEIKEDFIVKDGRASVPDLGFIGIYPDGSAVFFSKPKKYPNEQDSKPEVIEQIGLDQVHPIYLREGENTSRVYGLASFKK